jgi:hypothetical protein
MLDHRRAVAGLQGRHRLFDDPRDALGIPPSLVLFGNGGQSKPGQLASIVIANPVKLRPHLGRRRPRQIRALHGWDSRAADC